VAENDELREEWRPVPGFRGYEVSSHGQVRTYWRRTGTLVPFISETPSTMRIGRDRKGYKRIILSTNRRKYTRRISRLMLLAFVGPCPNGMEACHWDGNKDNDTLGNLRWDTRQENAAAVGELFPLPVDRRTTRRWFESHDELTAELCRLLGVEAIAAARPAGQTRGEE
jgi:hypothetical protein